MIHQTTNVFKVESILTTIDYGLLCHILVVNCSYLRHFCEGLEEELNKDQIVCVNGDNVGHNDGFYKVIKGLKNGNFWIHLFVRTPKGHNQGFFYFMNWMPPLVASNYKMSPISILCFDPLEELTTVQPPPYCCSCGIVLHERMIHKQMNENDDLVQVSRHSGTFSFAPKIRTTMKEEYIFSFHTYMLPLLVEMFV
jgi:hypothetical protein